MKQCLKWKISLEGINNWLDTKKEKKITEFGSIAMETMQTEAQRAKRQKEQIYSVRGQYQLEFCQKRSEENQKIIWRNTGKCFCKFDETYESTYSRSLTVPQAE